MLCNPQQSLLGDRPSGLLVIAKIADMADCYFSNTKLFHGPRGHILW